MDAGAVTFDFSNTLASCPAWFELEVRRLPSAFLRAWGEERGSPVSPALLGQADAYYRDLRREIMDHGIELPAEVCLSRVFEIMDVDVPETEIATGTELLMRESLAGVTPVPGALDLVREIDQAGVPVGVVSSAVYHPFLEWTLEAFGIREQIRAIVTSASAGFYKSRPEIYWRAAEALGARPERMVHVGDSLRFDVASAQRAGMGTIWLNREAGDRNDGPISPDLTLETLESAAPRILSLLRARQDGIDSRGD